MRFGTCAIGALFALAVTAGELEVAEDGTFRLDGKPVFLLGNIVYGAPHAADYRPFSANVPGWEWLYERPPSREQFDRLGFNATGGEVSTTWMRKYRPEASFWPGGFQIDWKGVAPGYYRNGLPVFVDFTCAEWSHGGLRYDPARLPSQAAFSAGDCHGVPYSLVTEEGFALYREMWQSGARELKANGVRPFAYELFDEPTYHDTSPAAEEAFKFYAEDKVPMHAPEVARKIARQLFDEETFARAMKRGKEALREIDPAARTCYQPLGVSFGRLNLLTANETTDYVMTPTGGGDAFDVLCCLAVAGNRPVVDGEMYLGSTRESHRSAVLREYMHGINAAYYFKWGRRDRGDLKWKIRDGARRIAEEFPYECLNPAACPPEAFAGLKDAMDEIAAVNDLFTPRGRGIVPEVALLLSSTTVRYANAAKKSNAAYLREAAHALLAARLPVKIIYEEQLDDEHLAGVKMLVAAAVCAVHRETAQRILDWVGQGGYFLTVEDTMDMTEWGQPLYHSFINGHNGTIGKGRFMHVLKRPSPLDAPADCRRAAEDAGVRPLCYVSGARRGTERLNVECAAARIPAADGKGEAAAGFIVNNNDLAPYAVKLRPIAVGSGFRNWIDVRTKKRVPTTADGELLLKLLPNVPVVLRSAPPDCDAPLSETEEAFFASLPDWFSAHRSNAFRDTFHVDMESTSTVDLSDVANGSLETRFGAMPWGLQTCEGVPFNFLRPDQNGGRSGVFLDQGPAMVPLRGWVRAFNVLFAMPDDDSGPGPLMDVVLECEAGHREKYEIKAPDDLRVMGWRGKDGRGLYQARFLSRGRTHPIRSAHFVSRRHGVVLAAFTLERLDRDPFVAAFRPESLKLTSWGGVRSFSKGDEISMSVSDTTTEWAGVTAEFERAILVSPADVANRSLVFEIKQGQTTSGVATRPALTPQVALLYDKEKDGAIGHGPYVTDRRDSRVDANSDTWQEIRLPLRRLIADREEASLTGFNVQFRPFGSQRAGFVLRAMRIE